MCDPTLVVLAVSAAAVGMKAQKDQADYNAKTARYNAALSRQKASHAEQQGALERDRSKMQFANLLAKADTAYATGNVQLGTGTPQVYQADLAQKATVDQALIARNTQLQAAGFLSEATSYEAQARMIKHQGGMAMVGTALKGVSSLLGSAKELGWSPGASGVPEHRSIGTLQNLKLLGEE